jgi:hypothetical protein
MISRVTCIDTCRWQVAQTVGHVMLDHMSSSGVMHRDDRRRGEERVKHEVKKKNISAVHAQYRNCYDFSLFLTPTRYRTDSHPPIDHRDSYL